MSEMYVVDKFVNEAETRCGETAQKFQSFCGTSSNTPWSASFVSYCASRAGVLDSLVPKTYKCQDIADKGTTESEVKSPGTWIPGPAEGVNSEPSKGDIVLISWSSSTSSRADHVGIVKSYNRETGDVQVIMGDCNRAGASRSSVGMTTFQNSFSCIKGYFRPRWEDAS